MKEADVVAINGMTLSIGQVMALRVACSAYYDMLVRDTDALGTDEHGRRMTTLYQARLGEVLAMLVQL